jgi:hypothetical protein
MASFSAVESLGPDTIPQQDRVPVTLHEEIGRTLDGIASYMEATATPGRTDRLWPASFEIFGTNSMSLAYGAAGPALFLNRSGRDLAPGTIEWLERQPLSTETYAPGFWIGLAGIGYCFSELGMPIKAEEAMSLCYSSPIRYAEASLFHGCAGWGLTSLYFFEKTQRQAYLDHAVDAARWLEACAIRGELGLSWEPGEGEDFPLGFAFGASGIALFLSTVGRIAGQERFIDSAMAAFEFDFAHRLDGAHGWTWPAYIGGQIVLPYWGSGAAGIGGVALRLFLLLGDQRYLRIAETIADASALTWTIQPGLVSGLSGIGEFMLDCYLCTGKREYLEKCHQIARTLLLYRIPRPEGFGYPDRWLARISNDVVAGSAGVGLFLQRLLRPAANPFIDLVSATGPASIPVSAS